METIKGKGPPKNFFFPFSLKHKRFLLQALSMAFFYSNNFSSSSSDEEVGRYEPIFFQFTWEGRGGTIRGIGY
jgi:hypothetical protein